MKARVVKFTFILTAFLLTILLFYSPSGEDRLSLSAKMTDGESSDNISNEEIGNLATTVMEGPNFTGESSTGKHWNMSADRAIQTSLDQSERIALEGVRASLTSETGEALTFQALEGLYMTAEQEIALNKSVFVKGYGYTLETEGLKGNMKTQDLASTKPVKVRGLRGTIASGNFSMKGDSGQITLSKGVTMQIYPKNVNIGEKVSQ